jgi:uncharacterized protein (DUF427 family)
MPRSLAYDKYPDHTLTFDEAKASVRILVGEIVLAETHRALVLREGRYPATLYLPRQDIDMEKMRPSDHSSHCPFKGDASYYDFIDADKPTPQIGWSYEDPFDEMLEISGYVAFYSDRAQIETTEG